jgi:hypothetical protein
MLATVKGESLRDGLRYRSGPSKAWVKTKNAAAPGMLRFRDEQ